MTEKTWWTIILDVNDDLAINDGNAADALCELIGRRFVRYNPVVFHVGSGDDVTMWRLTGTWTDMIEVLTDYTETIDTGKYKYTLATLVRALQRQSNDARPDRRDDEVTDQHTTPQSQVLPSDVDVDEVLHTIWQTMDEVWHVELDTVYNLEQATVFAEHSGVTLEAHAMSPYAPTYTVKYSSPVLSRIAHVVDVYTG